MSMMARLWRAYGDFSRGGPSFFAGALSARFSRADAVAVKLRDGGRVWVRPRQSDFYSLRQIFRDEQYRFPRLVGQRVDREYERICTHGQVPVVVDAGANIGAATLWFKARFPNAAIVAIEPDPGNVTMLRRNAGQIDGVTVIEAAIGGRPGFAALTSAHEAWAVQTERADTGCPIVTIDQAITAIPNGKLLIVKVDIEGFESDLFDGDLRWLDETFAVFVEPHDWMLPGKGTSRSFQAAFGERDFEIFMRGDNLVYVRRPPVVS